MNADKLASKIELARLEAVADPYKPSLSKRILCDTVEVLILAFTLAHRDVSRLKPWQGWGLMLAVAAMQRYQAKYCYRSTPVPPAPEPQP